MTSCAKSKREQALVVSLGDLILQGVAVAHEQLLQAARSGADLMVRLEPGALADLAGVQLLQAGRRWAEANGRGFALAEPAAGGLLETLRRGGFLQTAEQRRFWLKQEGEA